MIKPKKLKRGDKIAIVSLSWGGLGDDCLIHKYHIAKKRLEEDFGLVVFPMPNALKGSEFIAEHPELRAKDLMDAFCDSSINGIFCAIGGDDTIRLLPYIDYDIIRCNPKIFMGYSDTTANHFMLYKAGIVSFYGPSIMCEFGEYVSMNPYTVDAINKVLFQNSKGFRIKSSPEWSDSFINWTEDNISVSNKMRTEEHGYELLQGDGVIKGHLLGGCIDVFVMVTGTEIWPEPDRWEGAILFIETSEDKPSPNLIKMVLRNLASQGILKVINGILVGKPQGEVYYEEYKDVIRQVVSEEANLKTLPILYNVNFGHAIPIGILPYGVEAEINCKDKTIKLLESATSDE